MGIEQPAEDAGSVPLWWCEVCGVTFRTYPEIDEHLEVKHDRD